MRIRDKRRTTRASAFLAALAALYAGHVAAPPSRAQTAGPRGADVRIGLEEIARRTFHPWVGGIAFSLDSRKVAFAHWGQFTVLDADSGRELLRLGADPKPVVGPHASYTTGIAFGAGGAVALSQADEMIRVRDGAGRIVREFQPRPLGQDFPRLWAARRGERIIGLGNTEIGVWDFRTGQRLKRYPARVLNRAMDYSEISKKVATISSEHLVSAWDPMNDRTVFELPDPTKKLNRVKFFRDGSRLLLWDDRGAVFDLWDPVNGGQWAFEGHEARVNDVAPFPGRACVASASSDKTLRIWDATTGEPIYRKPFATEVRQVVIAPDGRHMVVDVDKEAVLFRVDLAGGPARRRGR
jgi:WD40 repeat protein